MATKEGLRTQTPTLWADAGGSAETVLEPDTRVRCVSGDRSDCGAADVMIHIGDKLRSEDGGAHLTKHIR